MQDFKKIQEMITRERAANAFIFLPSPILSTKDSFFMPLAEKVLLREDEVYKAQGKYRIHYNGLLRLSAAACMKWGVDNTCRTDDRKDRMYCSFKAVGGVLEADGSIQWHKAEKEIDLLVIADELNEQYKNTWNKLEECASKDSWKKDGHVSAETFIPAMVRRDSIQHRKNLLTKCESGAKARVIRSVLGLQGTYSDKKQLIGMPFIMIHYAQNPNHPQVKQHLLNALGASQNMIYGNQANQNQIAYYDHDVEPKGDTIDVTPEEPMDQTNEPQDRKFEPPTKPEEQKKEDGSMVDFENSDINSQVKILQDLCKETGEIFEKYDKEQESSGGIKGVGQEWRNGFLEYLINERKNKTRGTK